MIVDMFHKHIPIQATYWTHSMLNRIYPSKPHYVYVNITCSDVLMPNQNQSEDQNLNNNDWNINKKTPKKTKKNPRKVNS
jgi:hypothetical protein